MEYSMVLKLSSHLNRGPLVLLNLIHVTMRDNFQIAARHFVNISKITIPLFVSSGIGQPTTFIVKPKMPNKRRWMLTPWN